MGEHEGTEHDIRSPPRVFGVRLSALLEIIGFLAVTLAFSLILDAGNRFFSVSPHPFWIPVLLASTYYGANEGIAAAILSAAALLTGNLPEQGSNEDLSAWLLRVTAEPVIWFVAAIVLGQVGDSHRRERDRLRRNLREVRQEANVISHAYEQLAQLKSSLEKRVASQVQTVHTMYVGSRAIERQGTGEVLIGIADLIRSVMAPNKFSLFLLNGQVLEAAATEGWTPSNLLAREFDASSALFEAIVSRRQFLCVTNPVHEAVLGEQGVLAGPLVSNETGEILGMLKIEEIDFLDLHPSCVQNFGTLCEWIGTAFANAQRFEQLQDNLYFDPVRRLMPAAFFERQRAILSGLAERLGFDVSILFLAVELPQGTETSAYTTIARLVSKVGDATLASTDLRFEYRQGGWGYAILMPGADPEMAEHLAQRFASLLVEELSLAGLAGRPRHLVKALH
jgi:hypothetical protein